MKLHLTCRAFPSVLVLTFAQLSTPAIAQIVPDTTLPVNSSLSTNGNVLTIEGGTSAGGNLFHSFQDFSIPTGTEAFFNNPPTVENILTRVTGKNLSHIDGLIRANGSANLFLLNPNGIAFGPNARLDIGGSFFGTTADSIHFADGVEFSAQNPQATPLLSINVPVGLQMGQNPGAIAVRGTGSIVANEVPLMLSNVNGLRVQSGRTLGLVGGLVDFDGGVVAADSGRVELGSVREGLVSLNSTPTGWNLGYEGVSNFGEIQLRSQSLVDASGSGSGSMQIRGQTISLQDGSRVFLQNRGLLSGGTIGAIAEASMELIGTDPTGDYGSTMSTEALGGGNAANIVVSTPNLRISQGGGINTKTFTAARGGNITIQAPESIYLSEVSPLDTTNFSEIAAETFGVGSAGNIDISTGQLLIDGQLISAATYRTGNGGNIGIVTDRLSLVNGASITTVTLGSGQAGNLDIQARSIEVSGVDPNRLTPSSLSAGTVAAGNAGSLTIDTGRLVIRDGGRVDSSTLASGHAGSITVKAADFVEVSGTVPGVSTSAILSSASIVMESLQQFLKLPPIPSGDSGNVTVETPRLTVEKGAAVSVRNDGTGDAGTLRIDAERIELDAAGSISASTRSGEGGNMALNVTDLQLRNGSSISAEASGTGNGGNVVLDAQTIALLQESRITANALEGAGGNIQITTQGLFGSPDSSIAASSQFGVDGVVTITNPEVDPASSLISLSQETLDPSEQVVAGCQWSGASEFVATGRGGVPVNPNRPVSSYRTWTDVRDLSAFRGETVEVGWVPVATPQRIVEATGWVIKEDGTTILVAATDPAQTGNFRAVPCNPLSVRQSSLTPLPDVSETTR